ncbi:DUF2007 domain-containing protein [Changchengzhania lutea]|uniref:DUF2007 domain-containing protein n=1 Tax=Changchengzhania lutea TaxID=2049305 RepID=UPI00115D72DA|nr:DUF2007 domain-containing protein [Changchengzhania lutea]
MTDSNYIKIYTGNFIVVQRIIQDLKKQNINAIIKDETESGRLAGFGAPIQGQQEVFVNKDELEEAVLVVESITSKIKS